MIRNAISALAPLPGHLIRLAGVLWLLLALMGAGLAHASTSHTLMHCSQAVTRGLEQALGCDWQAQAPARQGIGADTRWMRLELPATPEPAAPGLFLKLRPFFLEHIRLHQMDASGTWEVREAGTRLPGSQPFATAGGYAFPLRPAAQPQTVYVEVQSPNVHALGIDVQTAWRADSAAQPGELLGLGVQLGLLGMVTLFALIGFLVLRQAVMGRFALLTVNVLACTLVGSGLLAMSWLQDHPGLNRWLFDTLLYMRLSLWVWVSQALLALYAPPAWWRWFCRMVHGVSGLAVVLLSLGAPRWAQGLMLPLFLAAPVIQAWAVWATGQVTPAFKRLMLAGFVLTGAFLFMALGVSLLSLPDFDLALYAVRLIDLANPLVLMGLVLLQQRWRLAELKNLEDDLQRSRMQSDFERRLLSERKVLTDMLVHELKNPLAAIRLAIGSLFPTEEAQDPSQSRRLLNIRRSISDMSMVLDHCALMNLLEDGPMDLQLVRLQLAPMVQEMVQASGQAQRFDLKLQPCEVTGDAHLMKLVLSNLIDNALKYSPSGSLISIELQSGPQVRLDLDNDVDPDMQPDPTQLFGRYYRHPQAQQVRGTGLGLYLVRAICQGLGVRVSSQRSTDGIRFTLEFDA